MRIQTSPKRSVARTLAASVVIAGMLTASAAAASGTIYACVKRTSGATRIVGAKTKCRRGEQKLSWGTGAAGKDGVPGLAGVPGAPGAPGAEGKTGADGAAVVFQGDNFPAQPLANESLTTTVSKVVPPGSYAVFSRTVFISEEPTAAFAEAFCELFGQAGTAGTGESTVIDETGWAGPLGEKSKNTFLAQASVSLQGVYTSAVTSTLVLGCANDSTPAVTANVSRVDAVGVTRIG